MKTINYYTRIITLPTTLKQAVPLPDPGYTAFTFSVHLLTDTHMAPLLWLLLTRLTVSRDLGVQMPF